MDTISMSDDHLTMAEAARLIPGHPSIATVHRWASRGVRGVVLASIRAGGRRYTTAAAIDQFLREQNVTDDERLSQEGC